MARQKRFCYLKLTREEAESLMDIGNRGLADLEDAMGGAGDDNEDDEGHQKSHTLGDGVLDRLGAAMREAWPEATEGK